MDDLIAIIISLAGSLGGIILGAVLIHFFALKKAKADIELEGIKKLAGILAQNFDQVKKPERNKIQSLMKTINDEIINKGYGIVLTKESNILLHLIRSNIEEGKWYQIPIPEEERFVLKDLIKKPFKKYLNLKKKYSKCWVLNTMKVALSWHSALLF